jgi:CheY-like chemotaxis protein
MIASGSPPKRRLILAVDDEPEVLTAIISALEAAYTVYTARSGAEARAILAQTPPTS